MKPKFSLIVWVLLLLMPLCNAQEAPTVDDWQPASTTAKTTHERTMAGP